MRGHTNLGFCIGLVAIPLLGCTSQAPVPPPDAAADASTEIKADTEAVRREADKHVVEVGQKLRDDLSQRIAQTEQQVRSATTKSVANFEASRRAERKKPTPQQNDPAVEKWVREVRALSAEKQVEAVAKKLQEFNPDFNGRVTPVIKNAVVTELTLLADGITNLSPVRALAGLKVLSCKDSTFAGAGPVSFKRTELRSTLTDLSSLSGMSLASLDCYGTKIGDLSPLEGMPLTHLNVGLTGVSDLSPLQGMSLTFLNCDGTGVSDLSPLKGMPLRELFITKTQVTDFSPLAGMKLTSLQFGYLAVSDLSPLREMPITNIGCWDATLADLAPLATCKNLKSLILSRATVAEEQVIALQQALPACKIHSDFSIASP